MIKFVPKSVVWLIPATALALVGSLTYATSAPAVDTDKDKTKENKVVKKVKIPHDDDVDTYLTSIRSFLLTPPRDGRFGASRIPTFHGASRSSIPGYATMEKAAKDYSFTSYVVGVRPQMALEQGSVQQQNLPKYRVTGVHTRLAEGSEPLNHYNAIQRDLSNIVLQMKALVDEKGYETYSDSITAGGQTAWIMAKSVTATDKSCYSCHSNIKEGQPIGHVMAVLLKNKP